MHASKHMWERMKKHKKEYVKTESEVRERWRETGRDDEVKWFYRNVFLFAPF